ncbi:hypothetical protein K445DRAFT_321294 [Daldinia sp. EC12]|nr:hypothetical protein K445DRAFT_321294 [Daldinia sp. EC12]
MLCISSFCDLCTTKPNYTAQIIQDLYGELCVFTDANTGPSKASRTLFRENALAWIAVRSEEKGRDAVMYIRKATSFIIGDSAPAFQRFSH